MKEKKLEKINNDATREEEYRRNRAQIKALKAQTFRVANERTALHSTRRTHTHDAHTVFLNVAAHVVVIPCVSLSDIELLHFAQKMRPEFGRLRFSSTTSRFTFDVFDTLFRFPLCVSLS